MRKIDQIPEAARQFILALERGRTDFPFFCATFLGMRIHPGQEDVVEALRSGKDFGVLALPNGWGKTVFLALFLLWTSFYRIWAPRWWGQYKAYAIGPEMKHALLVHNEIEAIRNNRHSGQWWIRGPGADQRHHKMLLASKLIPFKTREKHEAFLWMHNKSRIHFESSEEKLKALEGVDPNVVVYDEARRELYLDFVVNEVILPRGLRVPGYKVLLSSTPMNDSYDFFEFFKYPERSDKAEDWFSRKGNINENVFLDVKQVEKIANALDPRVRDQVLRGEFVSPPDSYFIRESVLSCISDEPTPPNLIEISGKYQAGHDYIAGADAAVSEGGDESVITVWDVTKVPFTVVVHKALPKGTPVGGLLDECDKVIEEFACQVGYDNSGQLGVEIEHQSQERSGMYVPIRFGGWSTRHIVDANKIHGTVGKGEALNTFRYLLNRQLWHAPNIPVLRAQILGYKLKDDNMKTDHLMANVVAAWLAKDYLPTETREGLVFNDMADVYSGETSLFVGEDDSGLTPLQRQWRQMTRDAN